MTRRLDRRAWLALVCAITIAAAALSAQQAPDRSKPPVLDAVPVLKLPPIEKRTLSNGLRVWIMGVHKVPTVHLELAVRTGITDDPAGKFGLASLTGDMLDEGAGKRNALEIADAVDFLGADLSTAGSVDASFVDLHVPVARLEDALPIMADVIIHPLFPEQELKRLRDERLAALLAIQDDPEQLIQAAFPSIVFGETHRYGAPAMGTPGSLNAITAADLKVFHSRNYRPDNSALIVTGDVTADAILPSLERALGGWKGAAPPRVTPAADSPQLTARRVYLIDKSGAAQSQIRMGWIGTARATPDYFALRVLNTILGDAFTSRLNSNLREVHGYAYGAASRFDLRLSPGAFYAAAAVQTDKTAEALKEFLLELTRIHEPVDPAELDKAKNYLALQLPRSFETTRATASALAQAFIYDLPADYYTAYSDRIRAVSAADVTRVADTYIQPTRFAIVIVGDRKIIEPRVKALNLGPVTVRDAAAVVK